MCKRKWSWCQAVLISSYENEFPAFRGFNEYFSCTACGVFLSPHSSPLFFFFTQYIIKSVNLSNTHDCNVCKQKLNEHRLLWIPTSSVLWQETRERHWSPHRHYPSFCEQSYLHHYSLTVPSPCFLPMLFQRM